MNTRTGQPDVAIVGGGPAGCAAALMLAGAGARVALIDGATRSDWRRGETVSPTIRRPLEQLGLWSRFAQSDHLPSPGADSCWGEAAPAYRDFVFRPHGTGWHLDRARFDSMLVMESAARGVRTWHAHAREAREHPGHWSIATTMGTVQARVLINAAGRQARFAMPAAGPRRVSDYTVAVGQLLEHDGRSRRMLIEASRAGWSYSAPVPGGRQVVMFFTDPDILRTTPLRRLLATLPQTTSRIAGAAAYGAPSLHSANAWCRSRIAGDTWLCVGDAAATVDPLSGQGVARALMDGILAGRTCLAMLAGDRAAGARFHAGIVRRFAADCQTRLGYYRVEARWPDAPFWQRRHQPVAVEIA